MSLRQRIAASSVLALALLALPQPASAITAEVAKKCNALTAKEFPLNVPGNPAAGSAKGSAQQRRDYFNDCIAKGGNPGDNPHVQAK
jgi:hypothetical protein